MRGKARALAQRIRTGIRSAIVSARSRGRAFKPVKVFTFVDFRTDFLFYQAKSLERFLREEFEFTVFDNTPPERAELGLEIRDICRRLGLRYQPVLKQRHDTANYAHAQAIEWAWHTVIRRERWDFALILDFDMFLVAPFSLAEYMEKWDLAGMPQSRDDGKRALEYLWPGLMVLRKTLPDQRRMSFMCDVIDGIPVDVGGSLFRYLESHAGLRVGKMRNTGHISRAAGNLGLLPFTEGYTEGFNLDFIERTFIHYGAGSNWDRRAAEYHRQKTEFVFKMVDEAVRSSHEAEVLPSCR